MEVGEGIEVVEGDGFARVMLPVRGPALGFVKGKRFETWVVVILVVMYLFLPVALALTDDDHYLRLLHPRDGVDVVRGVIVAGGLLMLEGLMLFEVWAMRGLFLPSRVTIVVDRHGVRFPMWGPLDLFRIKANLIRAVVVVRPRKKRRAGKGDERGAVEVATVRFEAGRKSRSIGGRYSREEALAAASILSKQIERVSGAVVGVRDELDELGKRVG